MSNLERVPVLTVRGGRGEVSAEPVHMMFAGREVALGESTVVRRLLPNLGRRLVGPWCFVDHYGPDDISSRSGMNVPPHPHTGLQTVSWLLDGEVHHRDSLGSDQLIRPGELGLMTAGQGIAHAEHSPVPHPKWLHGVQLWVALPDAERHIEPGWKHYPTLPVLEESRLRATLFMGALAGEQSPGRAYSPIVGIDIMLSAGGRGALPLEPDFEYALLAMSGSVQVDGVDVLPGSMLYLGCGRRDLPISADRDARLLLLGGEPFAEQIVMWWNFVGRTGAEIDAARRRWMTDGFGTVVGAGAAMSAPSLPAGKLKAGGSVRH